MCKQMITLYVFKVLLSHNMCMLKWRKSFPVLFCSHNRCTCYLNMPLGMACSESKNLRRWQPLSQRWRRAQMMSANSSRSSSCWLFHLSKVEQMPWITWTASQKVVSMYTINLILRFLCKVKGYPYNLWKRCSGTQLSDFLKFVRHIF